jgi:hypothetical protein
MSVIITATAPPASRRSFDEICRSIDAKATKALSEVRLKERELSMAGLKIEKPFDPTFGIPRSKKLRDKIGPAFPASNTQRRACLAEISRLDGLLTEHHTRQSNVKIAASAVARFRASTPTPPKSRKEIAAELWEQHGQITDPKAKQQFYQDHQKQMEA